MGFIEVLMRSPPLKYSHWLDLNLIIFSVPKKNDYMNYFSFWTNIYLYILVLADIFSRSIIYAAYLTKHITYLKKHVAHIPSILCSYNMLSAFLPVLWQHYYVTEFVRKLSNIMIYHLLHCERMTSLLICLNSNCRLFSPC